MVPDNEIVFTKLENKCSFASNFFVLMHFTCQKKKSNGVIHSVFHILIVLIQQLVLRHTTAQQDSFLSQK